METLRSLKRFLTGIHIIPKTSFMIEKEIIEQLEAKISRVRRKEGLNSARSPAHDYSWLKEAEEQLRQHKMLAEAAVQRNYFLSVQSCRLNVRKNYSYM